MTGYESKRAAAQDKLDSREREALKLALDALEGFIPYLPLWDKNQCNRYDLATTAIKAALAQPAQEPVGFVDSKLNPIQRPWVDLTNEDLVFLFPHGKSVWVQEMVTIIQAKLKEKNNG